jgi:stress response protein SCP2
VATELVPGANIPLPGHAAVFKLTGPFDMSALVLGSDGRVSGDADMVFYNQPQTPGIKLRSSTLLTIAPGQLRPTAERVVVLASPEVSGVTFGTLRAPKLEISSGKQVAQFVARLTTETAAQLVEIYRRNGEWRLRAIGQGYADGLAGLVRDFGVDVAEESVPALEDADAGPTAEVVTLTNVERGRHGLRPLTVHPRLTAMAQTHSEDMVRRAFFSHSNPDGKQVSHRAVALGYPYRKVAENIAAGQRSAAEVVQGWMDSPGHRANILDGELTQIGVGYAVGGRYGTTWTQVFGTPR